MPRTCAGSWWRACERGRSGYGNLEGSEHHVANSSAPTSPSSPARIQSRDCSQPRQCVTVILLPVGIPLIMLARRLFGYSMVALVPGKVRRPANKAKKSMRARFKRTVGG